MIACGIRQCNHIFVQRIADKDGIDFFPHRKQNICIRDFTHILHRIVGFSCLQQFDFSSRAGITDRKPHQKAVKLRLRQSLRSDAGNGILRGNDDMQPGQGMAHAVNGDCTLLHQFEQGRLCLAGGTVDLVSEQQVAECCTFPEGELIGFLVIHIEADNIRRQNIRCKLDTFAG